MYHPLLVRIHSLIILKFIQFIFIMQIEKLKFVKFVSHHLVFLLQNEFNSPKYSQPKKKSYTIQSKLITVNPPVPYVKI